MCPPKLVDTSLLQRRVDINVCLPAPYAHGDNAAAVPVTNTQPVGAPPHRPHASAVPAFIAMTLGTPVMQSQAANAQTACSAASSHIRIKCCHYGTRMTLNWPLAAGRSG